jgi:protein-disulfide isomerase/uncharacterized membrane protein
MKNKTIIPLQFKYYFIPVAILAIGGLADSIYLSISHYRVYVDIDYSSFCAISRSINCDTVSQSPLSILMGMPVPVWGVIGYTFFLICLACAERQSAEPRRVWTLLFLVAGAFSIYSGILAFLSSYYIRSYCLMCILSYGINFMLYFYCWLIRKRFQIGGIFKGLQYDLVFLYNQKRRLAMGFLIPFVVITGIGWSFFPAYWTVKASPIPNEIARGITSEGHPWIGASDPQLIIEEYSDYHCFQCRKMHFYLRRLVSKYPDQIRLIHRQFPMDDRFNPIVKESYHRGAGKMALIAIAAKTKGNFWEANDYLFSVSHQEDTVSFEQIAERIGMASIELAKALADPKIHNELKKDLFDGIKKGVTGTPAFVINEQLHLGTIPPEILKDVVVE